jgi:hypothetical protein
MLVRSPGFALVAMLSLALGIGANTAIFTVTNAVLLSSLPVQDPERLIQVQTADLVARSARPGGNLSAVSLPNYQDIRDENHVCTNLVAAVPAAATLSGRGEARPLPLQLVTANYFDTLGVKATHGRTFLPDEDKTQSANPVAVLSHTLWTSQFGADPAIVGQMINLNQTPFTVVGVTPPDFKGIVTVGNPDVVWIPISMHSQVLSGTIEANFDNRRLRTFRIFGRLKPGVSMETADAEMKTIASRLEREFPFANDGHSLAVSPLSTAAPTQPTGSCRNRPIGGCGAGVVDRVFQSGQPATGTGGAARARDEHSNRSRRGTAPVDAATAHGESAHGDGRRRRRNSRRAWRTPVALVVPSTVPAG